MGRESKDGGRGTPALPFCEEHRLATCATKGQRTAGGGCSTLSPLLPMGKRIEEAGGETPPLRQRIGAGAADKGDPAGRPYGEWGLAGERADTQVRPYIAG